MERDEGAIVSRSNCLLGARATPVTRPSGSVISVELGSKLAKRGRCDATACLAGARKKSESTRKTNSASIATRGTARITELICDIGCSKTGQRPQPCYYRHFILLTEKAKSPDCGSGVTHAI